MTLWSDSHMNTTCTPMAYRFGEFKVDVAAYELWRGARRVRLARQPMDLLLLLLERRQELVAREDIAKRLWSPDVFTDLDAGIRTAILKIRRVLGEARESPQFIETVPGKGYRLVAPVEVVDQLPPQALPGVLSAAARHPATRSHNPPADIHSFVWCR